jgi:hypothetical protein
MQVTKELLDADIAGTEGNIKNLQSQLDQLIGGLVVLKNIRAYMVKEETAVVASTAISEENAVIQKREEARQATMLEHDYQFDDDEVLGGGE